MLVNSLCHRKEDVFRQKQKAANYAQQVDDWTINEFKNEKPSFSHLKMGQAAFHVVQRKKVLALKTERSYNER